MPIFEADEPITDAEMQRQQGELNKKIVRLGTAKLMRELEAEETPFEGDCWLDDSLNEDEPLPESSTDEVH